MRKSELIEALAAKEHSGWAHWMDYLFSICEKSLEGAVTIPAALVERWQRQIDTPYAQLSEIEKQSDRHEVDHILPIIEMWVAESLQAEGQRIANSTGTVQEAPSSCNNTSVGIIVWRENCLLLLERKKFPFGMACPAGHVEVGETFAQAAARELTEETGLVAQSLRLVAEDDRFNRCRRPGGDWHHWQVFEAEVDEAQLIRWNADESKRIGWYAPEQVFALALRTQAYLGQRFSETDWQAAPGLEIVWYHWLHTLGLVSVPGF